MESCQRIARWPESARESQKVPERAAEYQRVPSTQETPRMDPENSWVIDFHPEFLRGGNRQEEEIIVL